MSDKKTEAPNSNEAAPAASGIKAMLPLILNVVLMPVVAYVMTVFVLLPKMNSGHIAAQAKTSEQGEPAAAVAGKPGAPGGGKISVPLSAKVIVNVSGTAGTRYLLANLMLVGATADLKEAIEKNDAQLRDVASSVLGTKTIADLDKPGSRNLIRTELISAFNGVLGESRVKEIYFTEFAIQ